MYVPTPAQGVQIGMYMEGKKEKTLRRKFWAIIAIKTNLSSHYARKSGCYFLYFGFINNNNRDNFLDSINRAFIAGYHTSKGDRNFIPDQTSFKQCFIEVILRNFLFSQGFPQIIIMNLISTPLISCTLLLTALEPLCNDYAQQKIRQIPISISGNVVLYPHT